VTETCRRLRCL